MLLQQCAMAKETEKLCLYDTDDAPIVSVPHHIPSPPLLLHFKKACVYLYMSVTFCDKFPSDFVGIMGICDNKAILYYQELAEFLCLKKLVSLSSKIFSCVLVKADFHCRDFPTSLKLGPGATEFGKNSLPAGKLGKLG